MSNNFRDAAEQVAAIIADQRARTFTVEVRDEEGTLITKLNGGLLKQQNVTEEQLENIKRLHIEKSKVMYEMYTLVRAGKTEGLKIMAKRITEIEFQLQSNWNFPLDEKFHRFWEVPGCTCPKMDNDDAYPTGRYVVNLDCPLHGNEKDVR